MNNESKAMDGLANVDVTLERLHEIADAFARRDVDGIVNSFAEDGEFRNAKGPDFWGQSYKGKAAIRSYFTPLFASTGNVAWKHTSEFICGNRAVTASTVQNIAVQILQKGAVQDELSATRTAGTWYTALPQLTGFVLNKNETPFAPLYWDRYEQIKSR